ncbi:hypothetical protein GQ44DRAFT_616139 [Phaeosphaeriaceae sp. PMI808]|nr:hypothetical protein GQ44DRAFT_616139 [Phaeosphaeriaceae sp. PMI808]
MHSITTLSIAALAALSAAQTQPQQNYPYTINPKDVSPSDRYTWCLNQKAQCPLICLQQPGVTSMTTLANDCDTETLLYTCICENKVAPNITQYSQTIPFYICQEWGNQCVKNCNGDNTCGDACRKDHPCGAQSPYKGNTSIPSASLARSTSEPTTKIPVTGFGGAQATGANSPGKGAAAGTYMPSAALSMSVVLGTAFLGFAVLL